MPRWSSLSSLFRVPTRRSHRIERLPYRVRSTPLFSGRSYEYVPVSPVYTIPSPNSRRVRVSIYDGDPPEPASYSPPSSPSYSPRLPRDYSYEQPADSFYPSYIRCYTGDLGYDNNCSSSFQRSDDDYDRVYSSPYPDSYRYSISGKSKSKSKSKSKGKKKVKEKESSKKRVRWGDETFHRNDWDRWYDYYDRSASAAAVEAGYHRYRHHSRRGGQGNERAPPSPRAAADRRADDYRDEVDRRARKHGTGRYAVGDEESRVGHSRHSHRRTSAPAPSPRLYARRSCDDGYDVYVRERHRRC